MRSSRWLLPLLSITLLLYPVLVFVALQYVQAAVLGVLLVLLVALRYVVARGIDAQRAAPALMSLLPLTLVGIVSGIAILLSNDALAVRLNPVWINLALLLVFGWSLFSPPSMIERFARIAEPQLPDAAIAYTRKVTIVWCVFFIGNAAVALWTAVSASLQVWTLYNGLIAYVLMGVLFAVEYLVRCVVRKRQR